MLAVVNLYRVVRTFSRPTYRHRHSTTSTTRHTGEGHTGLDISTQNACRLGLLFLERLRERWLLTPRGLCARQAEGGWRVGTHGLVFGYVLARRPRDGPGDDVAPGVRSRGPSSAPSVCQTWSVSPPRLAHPVAVYGPRPFALLAMSCAGAGPLCPPVLMGEASLAQIGAAALCGDSSDG